MVRAGPQGRSQHPRLVPSDGELRTEPSVGRDHSREDIRAPATRPQGERERAPCQAVTGKPCPPSPWMGSRKVRPAPLPDPTSELLTWQLLWQPEPFPCNPQILFQPQALCTCYSLSLHAFPAALFLINSFLKFGSQMPPGTS